MLPALPGVGATINGARLWIRVGPITIQPSEIGKILLMVFFASFLVAKRDVLSLASRRVAGLDLPRARDLGPVLLAWAASIAVLVFEKDLGSSLLFFGIFVVMLYIATERTSWLLLGVGLFGLSSFVAYHLFGHVREARRHLARPVRLQRGQRLPARAGPVRHGHRRHLRHRSRARAHPAPCRSPRPTSSSRRSVRSSAWSASWRCSCCSASSSSAACAPPLACRDSFGKLLAAGLSFALALQVFVIVGGVTGLIPLTGVTLPVVVLRRLVDRQQLRARRSAAAHQRQRPAAGARTGQPGHSPRQPVRRPDDRRPQAAVNRPLRKVAAACLALFALLLVQANWVQVVKAKDYRNDPRNQRVLLRTYDRERGPIVIGTGKDRQAVAKSIATNDPLKYLRTYPGGASYAPVTGLRLAGLRLHRHREPAEQRAVR